MPFPTQETVALLSFLLLAAPEVDAQPSRPQGVRRAAPFTALRWDGDVPEARVGGTEWFQVLAIDGTDAAAIVAWCRRNHGERWQKRFAEDLVEVLTSMGAAPGATADLRLRPVDGGEPIEKKGVPMTEANRNALRDANVGRPDPGAAGAGPDRGRGAERQRFARLAPFSALRWDGETPCVQLGDDVWYRLLAIDRLDAAAIVAWCKQRYGPIWQKRFTEDLVEVLTGMDAAPGTAVDLRLRALDTGTTVERKGIAMTAENRAALWMAANERAAALPPERLSRDAALADLAQAKALLDASHAYRHTKGIDAAAELAELEKALPADGVPRARFARDLAAHVAKLGDGHAGITEVPAVLTREHLPFLVGTVGERLVAFAPDRSGFVAREHPYLAAVDGIPIARWLEAASALVPQGAPQLVRHRSVRLLRSYGWLRDELGLGPRREMEVELVSEDGKAKVVRRLAPAPEPPTYGEWPRGTSRMLEGNVGYLRIPRMDDDARFLAALEDALARFRATKGLIIDVRGNGGGGREALLRLFPYFMRPDDAPRIANVAAARLAAAPGHAAPDDLLADRFLFPASSKHWSAEERAQVEAFLKTFRPEWTPPPDEHGPWSVLLLRRAGGERLFHYDRPVVVLMDGGCFSATDIFLGAMQGWRNVTLLGTASGGGSGRPKTVRLTHSQLTLRLSTMASFRPDGKLYDGRGIEPDVVVEPKAGDWIGATDTQLEAARKRLE